VRGNRSKLGTLSIANGILLVSDQANSSAGFQENLLAYHGKPVWPPQHPDWRPEPGHLDWHGREVFKGEASPTPPAARAGREALYTEVAMSRPVYLLALGVAAVGLAFTDWVASLRPGVTEANLKQVRAGMTLQEVKALLGGPGVRVCRAADSSTSEDFYWENEEGRAWVSIGSDGGVETAGWTSFDRARPGPLERLLAWLGS
jgi:hypothetical protein